MLSKTELKILEYLLDDITIEHTIREIALTLALPYPQTHRSVTSLLQKKLVKKRVQGKSSLIQLVLEEKKDDYLLAEAERRKEILGKYKIIDLVAKDLEKIKPNQFICILFGSHAARKAREDSDIDLLFIIPSEYDYSQFEKIIRNHLTIRKADINITTEEGLLEMWKNPLKLNVGNEILKKHIVLTGAEQFLRLRRKHYVG